MSLKLDFVEKAMQPGARLAPLCREFGISGRRAPSGSSAWFRGIDLGLIELLPEWFDQAASDRPQTNASMNRKNNNRSSESAA